ncbi:TVP38/TMEM64 family protein [Adlercreutzia sp. R25]|uniref:TVP38/TMEM64 family membrane protein n=1 Tax=Adlercreutzia shanghongiae TaxID=3111773 RepID=A0ABU6IWD4_9ACTN|nr:MULTISPECIES: TVP38/TMEM64 family protein [unclassified Adlercreutzia]MEC4273807.1 TVP38/TMEM64 family protein [Adlercreutzia sp. R25]MEC4294137.1 TVP38/TMEM64 family protein [Adlercreutzia sp. R22]
MSEHDNKHHSERLQKLEAKAHAEKVVAGREMPAANIFKFAGLIAFFLIMIVVVVALWPYIHELFEPGGIERVTADVRNAGPWGFLILLAIQFLQIVVAFIPGEVVQVAAGMIYGPWVGALIIWLGCIISSAFIFVLVHKLGAPFVQAMVPEKYMSTFRKWETSEKFNAIVFILFLIPGLPKDVFTYLTPLTHMSLRNFVIISNVARIPGIVLSTYAAAGLVSGDIVQSVIIFAVTAVVAIVALVVYSRVTKKSK